MHRTLSIFFNNDRTYLTGVSHYDDTMSLDFINSTSGRIDFTNNNHTGAVDAISEFGDLIRDIEFIPDEIAVTLPAESTLVTKFPGNSEMDNATLGLLTSLELRQNYPQLNFDAFHVQLVGMNNHFNNKEMMLAVIIPKTSLQKISNLLKPFGKNISKIDISQMHAHNAFIYNYPEFESATIMILGIQGQYIDVSILVNGLPIYYNLIKYEGTDFLQNNINHEYNQILPNISVTPDALFYYGAALTKDGANALTEFSVKMKIPIAKRLNGFRRLTTTLDQRQREYCSRTLQIYPSCIGACLDSKHKIITL